MKTGLKTTVVALLLAFGNAVTAPTWAQSQQQNSGCKNTAAAALIGGIFGAVMGGNNKATGAAIGGGIAAIACMALEASSNQTKSSAEVMQEYQNQHEGMAPKSVTLVSYESHAPTTVSREANTPVEVISTGSLVVPATQIKTHYVEEMQLYVPGEAKPVISRKEIALTNGGGGFQQSYKFALDMTFPQGQYVYKTRIVSANNTVIGAFDGKFQVI